MTEQTAVRAPFELMFEDTTLDEPKVAVRWCISKELYQELKDKGVYHNAYMVLVVSYESTRPDYWDGSDAPYFQETNRYVVKLTQEMQEVFFHAGGANYVQGIIVWPSGDQENYKSAIRTIMPSRRDQGGPIRNSLINDETTGELYDGQTFKNRLEGRLVRHEHTETQDFDVPDSFPKPPEGIVKRLLDKYGYGNTYDQCETREYVLKSIALSTVVIPIAYIAKLFLGLFAAFFLLREVKWSSFWRPLEVNSVGKLKRSIVLRNSAWFYGKKKDTFSRRNPRNPFMWIINPYTVFGFGVLFFGFGHMTNEVTTETGEVVINQLHYIGFWDSILVSLGVHVVLVLLMLLWAFGTWVSDKFEPFERLILLATDNVLVRTYIKRRESKRVALAELNKSILCQTMPHEVDYDQINTSNKTRLERIRLRKSRIKKTNACRPYSRFN